ncbi:glutamine synthetase family protein [Komagataeibacter europaeus]|uniref:glutamine synthetase family protein n=1 Tax=Komagataeibacter europaeus TaxID=33995 RepID=UPI0015F8330D|nr:glutamine synthetase family protein [Komagataeibacter europaeus]
MGFIEKNGLWNTSQSRQASEIVQRIELDGIQVVRFSFPDQHGILRGKAVVADEVKSAFSSGISISSSLLMKDTSHRTVIPIFESGDQSDMPEMRGSADMIMVPDPSTFRILPWAEHTGWILCDLYFRDGRRVPLSTRHVFQNMLEKLDTAGYSFMSGLEVEFHLMKLTDPRVALTDAGQPGTPPDVELLHKGYNYLTELYYDQLDPFFEILRKHIQALGLGLRGMEVEFGPSQVEFVFNAACGLKPADDMVLFRSAVKQIARRHGYHASFMCRPRLPHVMSSGWHLHQSLCDATGQNNLFMAQCEDAPLSDIGMHWLGGLLDNAAPATVFSTPTINGYKRYRPFSLAPDRAIWGADNRGVMLRVLGEYGDRATRIENRVGEPAANPYLYLAAQVACGMDGVDRRSNPGPSADTPYSTDAPFLPATLEEAVGALEQCELFSREFGTDFVKYFIKIKRAEIRRYNLEVSEWEHREYFDMF